MFQSVARTCFRRRRLVVVAWIGLPLAAIAASSSVGGELRNDFTLPGAPSQEAADLLESAGFTRGAGEQGQVVVAADDGGVEQPAARAAVSSFLEDVRDEVPHVEASDPYAERGLISPDGRVAIAALSFGDAELDEVDELAAEIAELRAVTTFPDGVQVELGGDVFFEESEFSSEGIGMLAGRSAMGEMRAAVSLLHTGTEPLATAPAPPPRCGGRSGRCSPHPRRRRPAHPAATRRTAARARRAHHLPRRPGEPHQRRPPRDDGSPTVDASPGFGLRGMAERVESLGGQLRHGTDDTGGWTVRAELPVSGGS